MKLGSFLQKRDLSALAKAAGLVAICLSLGHFWAKQVQEKYLHTAAPEFCDAKLHGIALIREAFSRPDTLVMFGSSELIPDVPMKGVDFFSTLPTGFSVFPVGKAGTTALSVLQKLGGAGAALSGKKVVISLSPSFFQSESVDPKYFEGNSSKLQAKEFLWSDQFSDSLKKAAAKQILRYPRAYEGDWLLGFTLQRVASGSWLDRAALALIEPYASIDRAIGRMQDHAEATVAVLEAAQTTERHRGVENRPSPINWDELLLAAEHNSRAFSKRASKNSLKSNLRVGERDDAFVGKLKKAQEWTDFELVLRLLREAGAQPLVISMPVHADVLESQGVSRRGWVEYGRQLRLLTGIYDTPLVYLEDHERDSIFFVDHADHIGSKGWWYYNKAMDDFYHNRLRTSPMASQVLR